MDSMLNYSKRTILEMETKPMPYKRVRVRFSIFFLLYCSILNNCPAQIISNIVGNGFKAGRSRGGYSGDGGPAIAAELYSPSDVIFDKYGNMYISEGNSCVRRMDASTGIITTIAGNGKLGFSGDGGPATNAELSYPTGLALDSLGNLYIADLFNNEIREVNMSNGMITVVAGNGYNALSNSGGYSGDGGRAIAAELSKPEGIAFDASGNMYIADCNNNVIRKVSKGVITTIAGNGAGGFSGDGARADNAELYGPSGVALDHVGNMYIADRENNVIRRVSLSTGVIITVAGNNAMAAGYTGDGGSATKAALNSPINISFDPSGNMYIADFYNNAIRKVSAISGIITTITPPCVKGHTSEGESADASVFQQPACAVADEYGNIYVADEGNNLIRKIAPGVARRADANDLASGNVVYEVQLMATRNKLTSGITVAGTNEKAMMKRENGLYKYTSGSFANHDEAVKYMNQLRAMGYTDAFVKIHTEEMGLVSNTSYLH
jgi:hypothetical protein